VGWARKKSRCVRPAYSRGFARAEGKRCARYETGFGDHRGGGCKKRGGTQPKQDTEERALKRGNKRKKESTWAGDPQTGETRSHQLILLHGLRLRDKELKKRWTGEIADLNAQRWSFRGKKIKKVTAQ